MLEAMQYSDNAFVTLTYSDATLQKEQSKHFAAGLPTLNPRDLQLFWKRVRKAYPSKLRYYAVGEYGDESFRPHYHAGIFGFANCARGETLKSHTGRCRWSECCAQCNMVGNIWGKGDIEIRSLGAEKCEYLARYVTKKMTRKEDARLRGRHPEFSRQSNRGGIGIRAVAPLAQVIETYIPRAQIIDVPLYVQQGGKKLFLGRYLRRKLRLALGKEEGTPDEVLLQAWNEQVLPLLKASQTDPEAVSLKSQFQKANADYEARLKFKSTLSKGKL